MIVFFQTEVHPLHNIGLKAAARASEFYGQLPVPKVEQQRM